MAERYNAAVAFVDRHLTEGRAEKVAFRDPRRALTYGELHDQASRVGPALAALGIAPEHRVVMLMLDTVDFPVVFWGAIRAGIIPVPLNTLLAALTNTPTCSRTPAPRALVVSAPLLPAVEAAIAAAGRRAEASSSRRAEPGTRHPRLDDLLTAAAPAAEPAATCADEVAFWLYSSGSTGHAEGRQARPFEPDRDRRGSTASGVLGIREDDVVFSAAKLFFAYGLGNALTFPMAVGATAALLAERPTPRSRVFGDEARSSRRSSSACRRSTPPCSTIPICTPENGSRRLRLCISAGEALPEHVGLALEEQVRRRHPRRHRLDRDAAHLSHQRAGRSALRHLGPRRARLRAARRRRGRRRGRATARSARLLVRGPSHAEGYWNQREKSRRTFEGAWTRTGDKYVRDADGRYHLLRPHRRHVQGLGIWVSPFEVEAALISHDAVLEAAVVPAEDADGLSSPRPTSCSRAPAPATTASARR